MNSSKEYKRIMPDYSLGKVYKIICNETGLIYVGSTCEPTLARRLAKHVSNYKEYLNDKNHFIYSFLIFEKGNYDIILLEDCPCETKDQLHARERHYIETLKCVNKFTPGRTREDRAKYLKNYYENNKIKHHENTKKNYILKRENKITKKVSNCECGGICSKANRSHHFKTDKHQAYVKTQNGL